MKLEIQTSENDYMSFTENIFDQLPDRNNYEMVLRKVPFTWERDGFHANERIFIDILNIDTNRKISIDMADYYINYHKDLIYNRNGRSDQEIKKNILNKLTDYIDISLSSDQKRYEEKNKNEMEMEL